MTTTTETSTDLRTQALQAAVALASVRLSNLDVAPTETVVADAGAFLAFLNGGAS